MHEQWNEKGDITVGQVLEMVGRLGIPHFQRGLVWGSSSISALLESLFLDVPCGSFVFWKSPDNLANGERLHRGKGQIDYLIIDGQQRIRSLHLAYRDKAPDDEDEDEDAAAEPGRIDSDPTPDDESGQPEGKQAEKKEGTGPVWCVNLTRIGKMRDRLEGHGKEYSLFVFTKPPQEADPRSPLRYNVVPWKMLRETGNISQVLTWLNFKPGKSADASFWDAVDDLREQLRCMDRRKFFVTVKGTADKAEIVGLYNRINSGGKRVEGEERAFARLVALHDSTWDQVSGIFARVHGRVEGETTKGSWRDDVLKRREEKSFGFRLFMRSFIQDCQFHFNVTARSSSFGIVERRAFSDFFADTRETRTIDNIWRETSDVLVCIKEVLEGQLYCDSFSLLPDSSSLMPVFQLLVQYPRLRQADYRPLLAWLILDLMLAEEGGGDLLELVGDVSGKEHVAFRRAIPTLVGRLDSDVRKRLGGQELFKRANSMQNRYVLLLYWLERSRGIRDFANANYRTVGKMPAEPPLLCSDDNPQKQHIVPFARLCSACDEPDVSRSARHRFNNLGNLTYMSAQLNGLDEVSSHFLKLEEEPEENLVRHFLAEGGNDQVRQIYLDLARLIRTRKANPDKAVDLYDRFCRDRCELIRQGFEDWRGQLRDVAAKALKVEPTVEGLRSLANGSARVERQLPWATKFANRSSTQRIQGFDFDNEVEDKLSEAASRLKRSCRKTDEGLEFILTEKKLVWLDVAQQGVALRLKSKVPSVQQDRIRALFGLQPGETLLYEKGGPVSAVFGRLPEIEEAIRKMSDEISAAVGAVSAEKVAEKRDFFARWTEKCGEPATRALSRLMEAISLAKIEGCEVRINKRNGRPECVVSGRDRGQAAIVLRAKTNKPFVTNKLAEQRQAGLEQVSEALALRSLLESLDGRVVGKARDQVDVPVEVAERHSADIIGALKKLTEAVLSWTKGKS